MHYIYALARGASLPTIIIQYQGRMIVPKNKSEGPKGEKSG